MKFYHLTIKSRNQKSISAFFSFFFSSINNLNFHVVKKYFEKKRKKKVLTILKSPHVNKKAQEQFEFRYYSKQIALHSTQNDKHLVFIKKVRANLFSDIKIKTKFSINKEGENKLRKQIFNPKNFQVKMIDSQKSQSYNFKRNTHLKVKNYYKTQNSLNKAMTKYLKVLDIYGELGVASRYNNFGSSNK